MAVNKGKAISVCQRKESLPAIGDKAGGSELFFGGSELKRNMGIETLGLMILIRIDHMDDLAHSNQSAKRFQHILLPSTQEQLTRFGELSWVGRDVKAAPRRLLAEHIKSVDARCSLRLRQVLKC